MSAIAGLYCFDQQPVSAEWLTAMQERLWGYGPDGGGIWHQGAVGLGQCQLTITPEDRYECQPLRSADGRLSLVCAARLDNRPELIDLLRIPPAEARCLPDSALLLRAYCRWGRAAPHQLIGDYAFALWDDLQQQLLLARSPLGNRPLYYHHTPRAFAFASMPGGLFALPWVARTLALEHLLAADERYTIYRDLYRVLPGHLLTVSAAGLHEEPFWQLDLAQRLNLPSDDAYAEAFQELFSLAVSRQLRSLYPVGVSMSGGLDSSAVAAIAAGQLAAQGQPLAAFTAVPRANQTLVVPVGRYADETVLVQEIARHHPNLQLQLVRSAEQGLFAGVDHFFAAMHGPIQNVIRHHWSEAIHTAAQAQGVRVLLTGERGNMTSSWRGADPLPALIRQGHGRQAWQVARQQGGWRQAIGEGIVPLLPSAWQAAIDALHPRRQRVQLDTVTPLHPRWILPSHRQQFDQHSYPTAAGLRQWRYQNLLRNESSDYSAAVAARFGISRCDPTSDVRLVAFCFAVPEEQWWRPGATRALIRRAMADRLPTSVLHNRQRGMPSADWYERLAPMRATFQTDLARLTENLTAQRYLDLPRLAQLVQALPHVPWERPDTGFHYRRFLLASFMLGHFILWFEGQEERGGKG
ncbi:MAG: hypothetical protein KF832_31435 [Caldilineaceae bacterium]|nr:hypothetical protein [Caldilineaceae bacterium]